jgi:F0F1-type ATP synthase assembly protein I
MSRRLGGEGHTRRFLRSLPGARNAETETSKYIGLGLTFALSTLVFFGLGYKLDTVLGTVPLFSVVGALLGGAGGFIYLYRAVVRTSDRKPPKT